MIRPLRWAGALTLAGLLSLTACIQFEQAVTLMPDGSGKMTLSIGLKKALLDMAKAQGKDPSEKLLNPEDVEKNWEGFACFTAPEEKEDGEFVRFTFTGYFEDINKVKVWQDNPGPGGGGRKQMFSFTYTKGADSSELLFNDQATEKMKKDFGGGGDDDNPQAKGMKDMFKKMFEDMKIGFKFTVPGNVTEATGLLEKKERTASWTLDGQTIIDLIDGKEEAKKKLDKPTDKTKIAWGKTSIADADVETFKKEFAAAKEKWKTLREELIKKAKERQKEEGGGMDK